MNVFVGQKVGSPPPLMKLAAGSFETRDKIPGTIEVDVIILVKGDGAACYPSICNIYTHINHRNRRHDKFWFHHPPT